MILNPICMIRQFGHTLQMHVNSFNSGHDVIYWQYDGEDTINQANIPSAMLYLDVFEREGVYWLWTSGSDGESRKMRVYFRADEPSAIIDRILGYTNVEQKKNWARIILTRLRRDFEANPKTPIIEYLYRYMVETTNLQDYERDFYYEFIFMAERYQNRMNIAMNSSLEAFPSLIYGGRLQLKTEKKLASIRILPVDTTGEIQPFPTIYKDIADDSDTCVSLPEETFGYIIPMAAEHDWLNYFVHYQFEYDYASEFWGKTVNELEQIDHVIADDIEMTTNGSELTEDDKDIWKLAKAKTPYDFIVPRPIFEDTEPLSYCIVSIPGWKLLEATNQQFYISTREDDLLLHDDFDTLTPIDKETVVVDRIRKYVDGKQFFYIQDNKGKIVSRLSYHNFQDVFSEEYREKDRQLYFDLYEKRIRNALRYYLPAAEQYVMDLIARFRTIPEVNVDELYKYILTEAVRSYADHENVDKLMFVILEDWHSNFNQDANFFTDSIYYYYAENRFTFPPSDEDEYLLCVETINFDSQDMTPKVEYYHSNSSRAISFYIRGMKYYSIYAINLATYHRSGFLFIDTYDHVDPIIYRNGVTYERVV